MQVINFSIIHLGKLKKNLLKFNFKISKNVHFGLSNIFKSHYFLKSEKKIIYNTNILNMQILPNSKCSSYVLNNFQNNLQIF